MTNFEVSHRNNEKNLISYFVEADSVEAAIAQARADAIEWNNKQGVAFDQMASEVTCAGQVRKVHG